MPTMNELLVQSGFDLAKPVGVIVEAETMSGDFIPTNAICGRVLGSLPEACRQQYPDFDLEYCVAIYYTGEQSEKVAVFELLDGAKVFQVEPTGLMIWHDFYRVFFGQTPDFFSRFARLAKHLPIPR